MIGFTRPTIPFIGSDAVRRISNSEITTWQDCPRRWYMAWHLGLRPRFEAPIGPLAMGSRVHDALRGWYTPIIAEQVDPLVALEALLLADQRVLETHHAETMSPQSEEALHEFNKEAELQRAMLEGYMEWITTEGTDSHYEVISAESFVEVPFMSVERPFGLPMVGVFLIGRLDVLMRRISDGALGFLDHKTVQSITEARKLLDLDPQMRTYRLILKLINDVETKFALYGMLRKVKRTRAAKPPFYDRAVVRCNPRELQAHTWHLEGAITRIVEAETTLRMAPGAKTLHTEIHPRKSRDCDWKCPFVKVCPMFDDGSRVEAALEDQFIHVNPLSYYDQEDLTRHES